MPEHKLVIFNGLEHLMEKVYQLASGDTLILSHGVTITLFFIIAFNINTIYDNNINSDFYSSNCSYGKIFAKFLTIKKNSVL